MRYRGRLASLLEVGTGFHRELTGRENIYLNGAILGMTRAEIDRQFDAIVEFAGVGPFLETPVKRYSSGMYVRLAFAVAAHLRTDILVVDEVLAVGDAEFQKKCLGKMQDVAHDGRTVLFVSHQMSAVEALCRRGILLKGGRVALDATAIEAIDGYAEAGSLVKERPDDLQAMIAAEGRHPTGVLRHLRVIVDGRPSTVIRSGEAMEIELTFCAEGHQGVKIGVGINDLLGHRVVSFSPAIQAPRVLDGVVGWGVARCHIPRLRLVAGHYHLSVAAEDRTGPIEAVPQAMTLEVVSADYYRTGVLPGARQGLYLEDAEWTCEPLARGPEVT
jgi:lipopolysaccharide transport system ATP-binding protein